MPDPLATARAHLAEGKPQDAWRAITGALGHPVDPAALVDHLRVAADTCRALGAAPLADRLDACVAAPDNAQGLYDTAYAFYDEGQYPISSALLYRANQVAPGQPSIVSELVAALEAQLRYAEAAIAVDLSGIADQDPLCAYLSGFTNLMTGDVAAARTRLPVLSATDDPTLVFLRDALLGMIVRANALTLDDHALTAWHAVLNASLLLHESPHGHPEPMNGRYAYVADSAGLEREGIERVFAVLAALDLHPQRILAAPDRASRILAIAASRISGLPWAPWDGGPGLVVAWSLETVEDPAFLEAMREHRPGQILFVHASCWTRPFAYAPDLTTFLHQHVTNPWLGGALRMEGDAVKPAPPDPRPDEEIAGEITSAALADPSVSSLESVVALAVALKKLPPMWRLGVLRGEGPRLRQRAGGPVPSNRFS